MDQFRRRSAATNGLTFLERALSSASIHHGSASLSPNITTKESPAEIKGPLGLNLLYAPSEPLVDFIFVHGLGGGSRKTWSQSENINHYWPQEWLSRDSDFKNVRTFSFGYKADWAERNASKLGVDDFAHALLGEIKDNPDIRRDETKIVFIGHSMGGLVMKQAYLLAVQDPTFYNLVPRFHSMYFLGTPHRGSQYAKVLNNILKVSYGTKPFTSDLERNTSMVSSINESFRHVANELRLFSFYETLQTNLHLTSTIIVDKYSATLQWPNERIAYLNADHRGMCKFDLPSDSNFKVLRNALSATTEDIVTTAQASKSKLETTSVDKGRLQNLLGISEVPDNERITVSDVRVEGSCEWLTSRKEFQSWTDSSSMSPPIFWLSGNPASGKSVLAGYVIDHLQDTNLECSYFFFKDSVASSSSIGDCLRAFAYQMALSSPEVRKCLLALESDCAKFDKNNESVMWNKLFLASILQIKGTRPHYWIIDALDECAQFQLLIPMLTKAIGLSRQIRIFITSRHNQPIDKAFLTLGKNVYNQEIVVSDTVEDIRKFVEAHMDALPVETPHSRRALTERILTMSSGSFLWVRLVVQELERVYTEEEVEDVLKDIPEDMNLLYEQILGKLSKDSRGARLAKVIFVWAVCAARPLSLDEMQCVLKLDAKATVNNLRVNINSICGQLVFVDQQSRVQMIHQTAKDFLLQKNLDSEFAVYRTEGHYRLATICLQILGRGYLRGNLMQQFVGGPQNLAKDGALTEYACTFFSDHLYQSPSSRSELFDSLHNFLDTNALWWIEYLAKRDLYYIVRAATNIKAYLERRQKHFPPFGSQLRDVEDWVVDLIRVSAKFRTSLLTSPSSIHGLIPSMCPSQSIIAKKYASPTRGLIVMGLSKTTWDDCLAQIDYRGKALQATSLTHGEKFFAVGLSTGRITLYHKVSGQVKGTFDHQENVKILAFGAQDKLLAASGFHLVCIWDVNSGQQQWCFDTSSRALALTFTADNQALMAPTVGNFVTCWDLVKGVEKGRISWYAPSDIDMVRQPPAQALISQDWKMLAVSFRGQPILLFDLESEVYFGKLVRDQNMMDNVRGSYYHATAMAFNPNPEINVLIVSYGDGELVAFDARSLELKCRIGAVHAQTLACSPDGRTLATGSSFGTIQLFDFDGAADETLSLIYRINAYEEGIKCLTFSHDSLRLVDIRGPHCRVWEPAVLVRKVLHDGVTSDISVRGKVVMQTVGMIEGEVKAEITAVAIHSTGEVVFCGKQDGCVSVYSTQDGLEHYCLYKHATSIAVNNIVYGKQRSILATADESGRLLVQKLVEEEGKWLKSQTLCDFRFLNSINGLLFSLSNEHLLVTTPESRHLWKGSDENFVHQNLPHQRHQSCKRMCHPYLPDAFIAFYPKRIRIYRWNDLEELSNPEGIELDSGDLTKSGGLNLTISCQGQHTIATLVKKRGEQASAQLQCWDTSLIKPETTKIEPFSGLDMIGPSIYHIISVTGTRLLFLDTDLWICSLNMEKFGSNLQVKRHFFIPSDWPPPTEEMQFQLSPNNDFVFVKKNELAVIKRGLEFSETMTISKAGQRQGLAVAF